MPNIFFQGSRGTRYNLMKGYITLWLFTKLGVLFIFVIYITKNCVFLWYTTPDKWQLDFFLSLNLADFYLKLHLLYKSSYYIVPSPSTNLPTPFQVHKSQYLWNLVLINFLLTFVWSVFIVKMHVRFICYFHRLQKMNAFFSIFLNIFKVKFPKAKTKSLKFGK